MQAVDRILTTVKRKLPRIRWSIRTRYSFEKKTDNTRELSDSKSEKKETSVEVSAKEFIKLHTHYSQTEITTHHMEYQNKVQLWKKRHKK